MKGSTKAARFVHYPRQKRLTLNRRSHRTQLMFQAFEDDNVLMIKQLFKEGGLLINARSLEGDITLLHAAVIGFISYPAVIRRLVKAGCHIDSKDFTGETALEIAVQYHRVPEAIQLIKLGANVHLKNLFGETPLHFAVANKSHVDTLKDMIPNGKQYSKVDFYGLKSLNWALEARSNSLSAAKR
ncbi:ankyrin repeat domain-containing protein 6-like [Nasonia vitripennis]|uniref:Uncharacterized protein n=1 Tax=Nasonia vitripennis TaxID=7425 RepID=A0A7M7H5Q6_NASVI|nr:ankyrin repeat domain-containing protein 6-like [Nasonia vitripennis]